MPGRRMRAIVALAFVAHATALTVGHAAKTRVQQAESLISNGVQQAMISAALSALLVAGPVSPALADVSMEQAIAEVNEASYPFIQAQKVETWQPFENKLLDVLLSAKPDALGATIDSGIDVFLSLPAEKVTSLNEAVKAAAATAKLTDGCASVVPSPAPAALVQRIGDSAAVKAANPEKIKAFGDAAGPALKAVAEVAKGDTICLPPVEQFNKLSALQIDLIESVDLAKGKAFDKQSQLAAKGIPTAKLAGLLPDARKLPGIKTAASSVELKQQQRLKAATGALNDKIKKIIQEKNRYG